jgi:phosphoglycerate dehydrogenase-like enzyme
MTALVVWNELGPEAGRRIVAAVPRARVLAAEELPEGPPEPVDVVFAAPDRSRIRIADPQWTSAVHWVHSASSGVERLSPALLAAPHVTCSRGLYSRVVAEFVLAALLAQVQKFPEIWNPGTEIDKLLFQGLSGTTVGLIGTGSIGREVALRAAALGVKCVGVRRSADSGRVGPIQVRNLDELLRDSDHIVVAAPATTQTRGMLGERAFAAARAGVSLVSVSSSDLIDARALAAALDQGIVSRATLDRTEPEPLPVDSPLLNHPRVLLSRSVAGRHERSGRAVDLFIGNLRRFVSGGELLGRVDVGQGY